MVQLSITLYLRVGSFCSLLDPHPNHSINVSEKLSLQFFHFGATCIVASLIEKY